MEIETDLHTLVGDELPTAVDEVSPTNNNGAADSWATQEELEYIDVPSDVLVAAWLELECGRRSDSLLRDDLRRLLGFR